MNKIKSFLVYPGIILLVFAVFPAQSNAGVNVDIGINLPVPPPLVFPVAPPVILIPGTYVYFVPDIDVDILFYHGYWYRPFKGHWYRANRYDEKWALLAPPFVPSVLLGLPFDHRDRLRDHRHIPYAKLKRNWRSWERDRYWDRHRDDDERGWRDRGPSDGWGRDYERHERGFGQGHGYGGRGGYGNGGHMGMGMGRRR